MRRQNSLCLAFALLFAASLLAPLTPAQSQDNQTDSVAEAARKARAQKKPNDKPAPVITDDILKPSNATAAQSQPGATASSDAATSNASTSAGAQGTSEGADKSASSEDKAKADAELARMKEQVAEAQKALDLAKRELALEQDNLYSKTDYQTDTAGKAKVDGLSQQVTDKQQGLEDLKTRLAELQSKADAQAPASEPPPSSPPQL